MFKEPGSESRGSGSTLCLGRDRRPWRLKVRLRRRPGVLPKSAEAIGNKRDRLRTTANEGSEGAQDAENRRLHFCRSERKRGQPRRAAVLSLTSIPNSIDNFKGIRLYFSPGEDFDRRTKGDVGGIGRAGQNVGEV